MTIACVDISKHVIRRVDTHAAVNGIAEYAQYIKEILTNVVNKQPNFPFIAIQLRL